MLYSLLKSSTVLHVVNLLLIEKSLIVFGENESVVSTMCIAFHQLLSPFIWTGVFIPLVPFSALDIVEAPVPFIIGVTRKKLPKDISLSAMVLNVNELIKCIEKGVYEEDKILYAPKCDIDVPEINHDLKYMLDRCCTTLSHLLPQCNLKRLQLSTFLNGNLNLYEIHLIQQIRLLIKRQNEVYVGDVLEVDKWRRYGVYDARKKDFEFHSQWFMDHHRGIYEYQNIIARTQMFASLIDKVRVDYSDNKKYRCEYCY